MIKSRLFVPGLRAPAVFLAAAALASLAPDALAQVAQPGRPAVSSLPVPSELELAKLV